MNETNDDLLTATISAVVLRSMGKVFNSWSMLFALAAILIISLKTNSVFLIASLIMALIQAYFAARCAFDAEVFRALTDY